MANKQLYAGTDASETVTVSKNIWCTDSDGKYFCGHWYHRTPTQLLSECQSTIADLLSNHPELATAFDTLFAQMAAERGWVQVTAVKPIVYCLECREPIDGQAYEYNGAQFCGDDCWQDYKHKYISDVISKL